MKRTIVAVGLLIVIILSINLYTAKEELNEYKKVYDGLILFEDGSWTYDEGVSDTFSGIGIWNTSENSKPLCTAWSV